jgi:ssDNA-binding Zn-finger/Zn-ribbon topoisomerase 1
MSALTSSTSTANAAMMDVKTPELRTVLTEAIELRQHSTEALTALTQTANGRKRAAKTLAANAEQIEELTTLIANLTETIVDAEQELARRGMATAARLATEDAAAAAEGVTPEQYVAAHGRAAQPTETTLAQIDAEQAEWDADLGEDEHEGQSCPACGRNGLSEAEMARETDGAADSTLCGPCYEAAGIANEHSDGGHSSQPASDCPDCAATEAAQPQEDTTVDDESLSDGTCAQCHEAVLDSQPAQTVYLTTEDAYAATNGAYLHDACVAAYMEAQPEAEGEQDAADGASQPQDGSDGPQEPQGQAGTLEPGTPLEKGIPEGYPSCHGCAKPFRLTSVPVVATDGNVWHRLCAQAGPPNHDGAWTSLIAGSGPRAPKAAGPSREPRQPQAARASQPQTAGPSQAARIAALEALVLQQQTAIQTLAAQFAALAGGLGLDVDPTLALLVGAGQPQAAPIPGADGTCPQCQGTMVETQDGGYAALHQGVEAQPSGTRPDAWVHTNCVSAFVAAYDWDGYTDLGLIHDADRAAQDAHVAASVAAASVAA